MKDERGEKSDFARDMNPQCHAHFLPGPYIPLHVAVFKYIGTRRKQLDFM